MGSDRLGDVLGGSLIILLFWLYPGLPPGSLCLLVILAAGAMLVLLHHLSGGHVEQLGTHLRTEAGELAVDLVNSARTLLPQRERLLRGQCPG